MLVALLAASCGPRGLFAQSGGDETSVITIKSAQSTQYTKDADSGEELITFSGNVSLSVESRGTAVSIQAASVAFNRATDMLTASGGVTLVQEQGSSLSGQTIYADSLLLNTKTMEGIFDGARVFQTEGRGINVPTGSALVVSADVFGRDSSGTVVFKNAELTFCEDDDPHWKIKASRIWLLPGEEFAFFNAVLSIGNVPILYLPAFYYPKDELLFHPAFGYDTRRGYFFQSTTYVYGRKGLAAQASTGTSTDNSAQDLGRGISNFMRQTELKEQRREGLVLHNLDEPFTGDTSHYVKVLADYYTNIGGMLGVDSVLAPGGIFQNLSASLRLGFSTAAFPQGSGYTQYAPSGTVYYNRSSFLGLDLPFRYSANIATSITSPLKLSVSLPVYSDPFFDDDFAERTEDMDWIAFLMDNATSDAQTATATSREVSSFAWNISASYAVPVPKAWQPYISTLSVSELSSSVQFSSRKNDAVTAVDFLSTYSPQRKFFYPSQITPVKFSSRISGTLVEYPRAKSSQAKTTQFPVSLAPPPEFAEPDSAEPNAAEHDSAEHDSAQKENDGMIPGMTLPQIAVSPDLSQTELSGLTYKLTYSVAPQAVTQVNYDGTSLSTPGDFDFAAMQSVYVQLRSPTELSSVLSYRSNFFSLRNTLSFAPVYQAHPRLDGYSESSAKSVLLSDYRSRKLDLTGTSALSVRPFIYSAVFKNSGIDWNTTMKLVRTEFTGTADEPLWEYKMLDVTDRDSFTAHTLSATIAAQEAKDVSQSLVLSTTLPPQLELYRATLTLAVPHVTASLGMGLQKKTADSDEWTKLPLTQSLAATFFAGTKNALTFSQSYAFSMEEQRHDSFRAAVSWQNLSASYAMQYTYGYDFDAATGWTARTEKQFLPVSISIAYSLAAKAHRFWKNRVTLTPALSTSIVYDCLRPTSSYFRFQPSLSFSIADFLELTFSSETRNDVIYRYVQNLVPLGITIPGETNVLKDLLNSFAFWGNGQFYDPKQTLRNSSGFKLRNLSLKVSHNLHDWDLAAQLTVSPRIVTENGRQQYSFEPYFTVSVAWKPLSSMKAQLTDNYGTWEF